MDAILPIEQGQVSMLLCPALCANPLTADVTLLSVTGRGVYAVRDLDVGTAVISVPDEAVLLPHNSR